MYFHHLAVEAGELTADDVYLSALPAPFGFGIWTAHVTPTVLGAPCVILERFTADDCLVKAQLHGATVLTCVSTQFSMMLNSPAMRTTDLGPLRAVFTGGEAVPYAQAARFEETTGAAMLQFFGSNETGALSYTAMTDTRDRRLRTAGRIIPPMRVRLYDEQGAEVPLPGRGIPAGKGPATCLGYLDDPAANAALFTPDNWMLMGDIVEIDADGYLTLVGRTSDIIIRGGKNISAVTVEEEVSTHPAVALAAAVAMPDETFGERVCVYVEVHAGQSLDLVDLVAHLTARGVSKEYFPEHLIVLDELPRSSGRKVAKGELRADLRRRSG
jgi:acyl-CoA synthetase